MTEWVVACAEDDVDEEDVIRFDHGGRTFAIYRSPGNEYFATDESVGAFRKHEIEPHATGR